MIRRVEIAGLPGVGKTTFVRANEIQLAENYLLVESRSASLFQIIFAQLLRLVWLERVLADKKFAKALAYRLSFRFLNSWKPVLHFDSGIVQLLLEHLIERGTEDLDLILAVYQKAALPDKLIYLEDALPAVLARERGRPAPRYPAIPAYLLEIRYKEAEAVLKTHLFPVIPYVRAINAQDRNAILKELLP